MKIKDFAPTFLFIFLFLSPIFAFAQTGGSAQQNAAASASVRARYNPSAQINSTGSTFQGIQFSGVGGAIAGCANVGGLISKGLNSLTGAISKPGASKVPVTDSSAQSELKQANRTSQCLNGVAYAIAKNLLQQVTNKTISWVNSGLGGNSLYIKNPTSYLQSIRDQKINDFLRTVPSSNPVFGNALRSIITENITGKSDGLLNKAMDTPQGRAYEAFQKDFTDGGWQMLLDPAYNPIDVALDTADELNKSITTAQQDIENQVQRNGGYLDVKRCVQYAPYDPIKDKNNPLNEYGNYLRCLKSEVVTPGSAIQSQVNTVLTSPIRQLEQADQINEVLGAFFDQLLNRLFARGLANVSRTSGGAVNSSVVVGANGQPLSGDLSAAQTALGYQTSGSGSVQEFDISRPQQLRAVIKTQLDFINRSRDAQVIMAQVVPTLGALDYCMPGPNPTWTDGLDDNYLAWYNSLETPDKTRTAAHNFLVSLPIIGALFGGGSNTIDNALVGQPILTDKTTDTTITLDPIEFVSTRRFATHGDFKVYFDASYGQIIGAYRQLFAPATINAAFVNTASTPADQSYAAGFVTDALRETKNLIGYNKLITTYNQNYEAALSDTSDAITELKAIDQEVENIVATAKARYISEQQAAGTPVDLACINEAYSVSTAPIVGVARQESDVPSPILQQSTDAAEYFYSHL